jgi:hypothetical protein
MVASYVITDGRNYCVSLVAMDEMEIRIVYL